LADVVFPDELWTMFVSLSYLHGILSLRDSASREISLRLSVLV
jgi:hypothetical protein